MRLIEWLFGRREQEPIAPIEIKPPVYRFTGSDESLAARTRQRREASDAMRARAARVDSGDKVGTILKMVRK
jgi:hypothetical protein